MFSIQQKGQFLSGNIIVMFMFYISCEGIVGNMESLIYDGLLNIYRLPKKQDMTRKLWWNFSVWSVFVFLLLAYFFCRMKDVQLLSWLFQLIRRRYFSDDVPAQNPWSGSPVQKPAETVDENWSDEDHSYRNSR